MAREQITFTEIDPTSLSAEQQQAWQAFLAAKEAFKTTLQTMAPEGHRVLFSDKYNKLKLGMIKAAQTQAAKPQQSLADFLASAQASGRRA